MNAIDTGILIWGIRQHLQSGREDLIPRCKRLIESISDEPILVSAVSLAEFLTGMPGELQSPQIELINTHFVVRPFGAKAASVAANIYNKAAIKQATAETGLATGYIKADLQILATAIAEGAHTIYADDGSFKTLALGQNIIVKPIPALIVESDEWAGILSEKQRELDRRYGQKGLFESGAVDGESAGQ